MSKSNILIKITGSIAAYKSAYLISKLVQNGFNVKTVVTESALYFIGKATLEGLTGNRVYTDTFADGEMMSHINLVKWADLTIVVPADANTLNKFANGIADNLVTSLFLANEKGKPYLIAPAMNVNMYEHPATQKSLNTLVEWGIKVLPTDEGYLACGDEGKGKLLDPDKIYNYILKELNSQKKKVLLTVGGTREWIDNVRYITNLSTGQTGNSIADSLFKNGYNVTILKSEIIGFPESNINSISFDSYSDLKKKIKEELKKNKYDLIIHLAAVSDYSPVTLNSIENKYSLPIDDKVSSSPENISIDFRKNEKIANEIKKWSLNKEIKLIAFKLLNSDDSELKRSELDKIFTKSNSDFVVVNSLTTRENNKQRNFQLFSDATNFKSADSAVLLTELIIKDILEA